MRSLVSKKHPNIKSKEEEEEEDDDPQEESENRGVCHVSTHLYLKSEPHGNKLDKAVVLRRILHRKRINKVKSAVQAFLGSTFIGGVEVKNKNGSVNTSRVRWADDAFAAP